ncbi:MAG: molybdopterin converting factor subunit 1 [Pseudomonadota bacterium]
MKVKYFAWVRERIGLAEEDITLPPEVDTAHDLILHLKARGEGYAEAFARDGFIRVAADHTHITHDVSIRSAREVAIFPPMTGG